jgi:hypothetical protein
MRSRELSKKTLFGRVHEQVRIEAMRDVAALYAFIDPRIRARREHERDDEPALTLDAIEAFVRPITTAVVEDIEVVEATKRSERQSGRSEALVRTAVRYNDDPTARRFEATWVRDEGVWYTTDRSKHWPKS